MRLYRGALLGAACSILGPAIATVAAHVAPQTTGRIADWCIRFLDDIHPQ